MNAAPDGENAQDGFGLSGLSAMQPLCSVSPKVFTTFFIFDLGLSRDSSNGSGERKEEGLMTWRGFYVDSCGVPLTSNLVPAELNWMLSGF